MRTWPAMPSRALGAGVKRVSRSPRLAVNWHNTRTATDMADVAVEEAGAGAGVGDFLVDMGIRRVC